MRLYALMDRKLAEFGVVMVAANDEVMVRVLKDSVPPQSNEGRHPEDFDLYFLGSMNVATGVISASAPQLVSLLSSVLSPGGAQGGELRSIQ